MVYENGEGIAEKVGTPLVNGVKDDNYFLVIDGKRLVPRRKFLAEKGHGVALLAEDNTDTETASISFHKKLFIEVWQG